MDTQVIEVVLATFLALSVLVNLGLAYVIYTLINRLLQFDELFELLSDDVEVNVKFFQKLLSTPLFEASNEIIIANNNMAIISQRLNEFVLRMEELTNRKLKSEPKENPNPPKVV